MTETETRPAAASAHDSLEPRHPLHPVTADEYRANRSVLDRAGKLGSTARFCSVSLLEPHKRAVLDFKPGDPLERRLLSVLLDVDSGAVHEAVVSVTNGELVSFAAVNTTDPPYGQPPMLWQETDLVAEVVRADPQWQEAMGARGISDTSKCVILPLAPGQYGFPDEVGRRVLRCFTLYRKEDTDSPWARPVEGLVVTVDCTNRSVISVSDYGHAPLPAEHGNFREGDWGPTRTTLKPLNIEQPDGPSFTVDGRVVNWERWSFRIGFDPREGLVLHQVSFDDDDRRRPIIYRASIAEMVVPYGDPHPARFWISYFDAGEYGLGRLASPLALGCDCLGEIRYFDATLADDDGNPVVLPNVVCMHEEDYGILWKHSDFFTGVSETRRSRRLVISFFTAIGNYDYGFFWYLYQDGTIQLEAKLTGIVFANAQPAGDTTPSSTPHATPVAPGLVAPYHQHLFSARLDMTVDGVANTVEEVDVVPVPIGPDNTYGNAFTTDVTVLNTESVAARMCDVRRSRTWRVVNRSTANRYGQPVGYKLIPSNGPTLLADPTSSVAQRATFATKHLWVTRYDPTQRYAAGDYPNQHAGGDGLPTWVAADRALDDEDVVLWHTFGSTHIPRPEDWPVMPVEYTGFMLKPSGFFDRNPALDLPHHAVTSNGHREHTEER